MGLPGRGAARLPRASPTAGSSRASARRRATWLRPSASTSLIAGTGFGGSITAYRLAELYRAAGADPRSIVVLERGRRHRHDGLQAVDAHRAPVRRLPADPGPGRADRGGATAWAAARRCTWRRRCARRARPSSAATAGPATAPSGACGPAPDLAQVARPLLPPGRAGAAREPPELEPGVEVGRRCGRRPQGGRPHLRPRAAGDQPERRCQNVKWCHTGCIFGAKNTLFTNYLASAERLGVQRAHRHPGRVGAPVQARPYRYTSPRRRGQRRHAPAGAGAPREFECKVLVLATGAMGNAADPDALADRPAALSSQLGKHLGVNGDHVAAIEYDPQQGARVLGLPGYTRFPQGQADHHDDLRLLGRPPRAPLRRDALQPAGDLPVVAHQLPLRRRPLTRRATRPGGGCRRRRRSPTGRNRIELLAMVEDTNDGEFFAAPPQGGAVRPNAGPGGGRALQLQLSEQSLSVREAADTAMARIAGAPRPRPLHEAHRDRGRVRLAPARRLPHGRVAGPRRDRPQRRRVRLRGPLLHRLLDHPDLAGGQPVAHDRRGVASAARRCWPPAGRTSACPPVPAGFRFTAAAADRGSSGWSVPGERRAVRRRGAGAAAAQAAPRRRSRRSRRLTQSPP